MAYSVGIIFCPHSPKYFVFMTQDADKYLSLAFQKTANTFSNRKNVKEDWLKCPDRVQWKVKIVKSRLEKKDASKLADELKRAPPKGFTCYNDTSKTDKPVVVFGRVFETVEAAAKATGINATTISYRRKHENHPNIRAY